MNSAGSQRRKTAQLKRLLDQLPLDSGQRRSVEETLGRQEAEFVDQFVVEASGSLTALREINAQLATLRGSMGVIERDDALPGLAAKGLAPIAVAKTAKVSASLMAQQKSQSAGPASQSYGQAT